MQISNKLRITLLILSYLFVAGLITLSTDSRPANIEHYVAEGPVIDLVRTNGADATQQSTLFLYNGNQVSMANGGGQMMYRTDMADSSTSIRELRSQNGCSDIEGGYQYGDNVLLANENTPATILVMPGPDTLNKCTEALESFTLSGMDESRGSWGIEGIAILQDGRFVVVKQNEPARIAYFDYVPGTANYDPIDLFPLVDCSNLGDVTVRPNGNILIICKTQESVKEYTVDGALVSTLPIPQFGQPEGIMEYRDGSGRICINGEAGQYQCLLPTDYVEPDPDPDPVEPTEEECVISGNGTLTLSTMMVTGTLDVVCPNHTGQIEIEELLN